MPRRSDDVAVGWRCWRVDETGYLRPLVWVGGPFVWPAGKRCVAKCPHRHVPPCPTEMRFGREAGERGYYDTGCKCGLHAWKEKRVALLDWHSHHPCSQPFPTKSWMCVGRVSLWGHVREHERGWRAEFAYPYDIYMCDHGMERADMVARRYGVEVLRLDEDVHEGVLPRWKCQT